MTPGPPRSRGLASAVVVGLLTLYAGYTLLAVFEDENRPGIGIEVYTDRTVDLTLGADAQDADWPRPGDRLARLNGQPLADGADFERAVAALPLGARAVVDYDRAEPDGSRSRHTVTAHTRARPFIEWLCVGLLYWVSGVTIWLLALLVALSRPTGGAARAMLAWLFINGLGMITGSVHHPAFPFADQGVRLGIEALIGAASLIFLTGFPRPLGPASARIVGAVAAAGALAFGLYVAFALARPVVGAGPQVAGLVWAGGVPFLTLLASLVWNRLNPRATQQERIQGRIVLVGALVSYGPAAFAGFLPHVGLSVPGLYLVCPLSWVMPASLAIAVIRHRLFAVDALLRPTLAYTLTLVSAAAAYLGIVELMRAWLGSGSALVQAIATATIALAFVPLRDGLGSALARTFFRSPYDPVTARDAFEAAAATAPDAKALATAFTDTLDATLAPAAQRLELAGAPGHTVGDRPARWALELPIGPENAPVGAVMLGAARSGRRYRAQDRAFVEGLALKLALWLDRLAAAEAGQRRVEAQAHAVAMQEKLLSIVSHELRTPISAIIQATALVEPGLSGEPEDPDWESYRSRVARQSKTLSLLVDDLLQAGQIQTGALVLRPRALDLAQAIDEAVADMEPLADARQVTLEVGEVADFPVVLADPNRLLQVLRNLLHNAIKHSPALGAVAVTWAQDGDFVRVSVRDEGPGVAPEEREALFNRFGVGSGRDDGIGLGLYIVKSIVESHGTDQADRPLVGVDSAPGAGATFWFLVPLAERA